MKGAPIIIGVGGPSGAGKSTIALGLCARLPDLRPLLLPIDAYYHDLAAVDPAERAHWNFDAPAAIDWHLLIAHVGALGRGEAIERPVYRFDPHTRDPAPMPAQPGGMIVVDGLYALYRAELRDLMMLRVFVTAGRDVCLERRIARDVRERGRARESVIEQVRATVEPMYAAHVEPTRAFANVILDGEMPVDDSVEEVLRQLVDRAKVST